MDYHASSRAEFTEDALANILSAGKFFLAAAIPVAALAIAFAVSAYTGTTYAGFLLATIAAIFSLALAAVTAISTIAQFNDWVERDDEKIRCTTAWQHFAWPTLLMGFGACAICLPNHTDTAIAAVKALIASV